MNLELDGRVALVSGCSQGLGYACVRTLARHGADIFGVSIGDDSALKKEVEALGRSYHSLTVSLTTPGSIHDVMKEVLAAYGHVDILLNFAGILKKEDTLEISRQAFQSALDINLPQLSGNRRPHCTNPSLLSLPWKSLLFVICFAQPPHENSLSFWKSRGTVHRRYQEI